LNPTETGLEIVLKTAATEAEQLQISNRTQGNTYIAEIPNAQLQLPDGKPFRQENPIKGIREVTIANSDRNTIRVSVVGETTAPQVELFDSDEGLIFALTLLPLQGGIEGGQENSQNGQIIPVTDIQLNPTETGIELILQTPPGVAEQLQPNNLSSGNNFIAEIPNAQLQLPDGKPFRQENPTRGISEVSVTNFDTSTIRVIAIGETALPQVELFDSNEGLIFGFTLPSLQGGNEGERGELQGSQIVTIDRVQLNPTETGFEILLLTPTGTAQNLRVVNVSEGNNFIAEIQGAQINLPDGKPFRIENPIEEVSEVTVVNRDENTVQVTVIGEEKQPTIELFDSEEGLIFSTISEASDSAQTEQDIELVVTGEQDTGYRVPNATTATRTDTPIRDIPQSIQVIPKQVLEDQGIFELTDALRNVSGVVQEGGSGGTADQLNIRGFFNDAIFRDGFRDGNSNLRETANIEQIEVLKGPASILFGNAQPGGIINLVSKKPLSEFYAAIDLSIGDFSLYRPAIDVSGPLNRDRTLLYRLNLVYENAGSFRDFVNSERFFVEPVLAWKISNSTDLSINFSYLRDRRTFDRGIPAFGRGVADIPINRFLGQPGDFLEFEEIRLGYQLEHRFNENLTLRNRFQYLRYDEENANIEPEFLDETTGDFFGRFVARENFNEIYSLQTDLLGKFSTGSIEHQVLFGVDFRRDFSTGFFRGSEENDPKNPIINIFNPVYGTATRPDVAELNEIRFDSTSTIDSFGIFLQNQIAFLDNLKLLIGGRFDTVNQDTQDRVLDESLNQYDEAFSPRIGIVYQPIEPISLYASFSRSFAPNFAQSVDGSILEPERGTQYEVGIKTDFNDRLSATLAFYQLTKTNIATVDPDNPDFSIPIGEQRSRGIELDISGEILPGWNVIASYAYTDAEITESNDIPVGTKPSLVPEHKASLWTTYEIQQGDLKGLGFGLGFFYFSERPGDLDNSFELPSYLRTDMAIFYKRDNWKAAVNIQNLFDVRYFESVNYGRVTVEPGAPLRIVGSFSIEF
ncbi:MAG: TonB-dependent receptor, partial [Hydrococcus sp. Prado102]|nr:TonB-dependent receptor [Hydrococcus sp. Prado102]